MSRNSRMFTTRRLNMILTMTIYMSRNSSVFTTMITFEEAVARIYMSRNSRVFTTLQKIKIKHIMDLHE